MESKLKASRITNKLSNEELIEKLERLLNDITENMLESESLDEAYFKMLGMSKEEAMEVVFSASSDHQILELFFSSNADLHLLLDMAFKARNCESMRFLVGKGYDVNKVNKYIDCENIVPLPALMDYLQQEIECSVDVVRALVDMGADVNAKLIYETIGERNILCSPLYLAVLGGDEDIIHTLAKLKAVFAMTTEDEKLHSAQIIMLACQDDETFEAIEDCYSDSLQNVIEECLGWAAIQDILLERSSSVVGKVLVTNNNDFNNNNVGNQNNLVSKLFGKDCLQKLKALKTSSENKQSDVFRTQEQVESLYSLSDISQCLEEIPLIKYALKCYRVDSDDTPMMYDMFLEFMDQKFEDKQISKSTYEELETLLRVFRSPLGDGVPFPCIVM